MNESGRRGAPHTSEELFGKPPNTQQVSHIECGEVTGQKTQRDTDTTSLDSTAFSGDQRAHQQSSWAYIQCSRAANY